MPYPSEVGKVYYKNILLKLELNDCHGNHLNVLFKLNNIITNVTSMSKWLAIIICKWNTKNEEAFSFIYLSFD